MIVYNIYFYLFNMMLTNLTFNFKLCVRKSNWHTSNKLGGNVLLKEEQNTDTVEQNLVILQNRIITESCNY